MNNARYSTVILAQKLVLRPNPKLLL